MISLKMLFNFGWSAKRPKLKTNFLHKEKACIYLIYGESHKTVKQEYNFLILNILS